MRKSQGLQCVLFHNITWNALVAKRTKLELNLNNEIDRHLHSLPFDI